MAAEEPQATRNLASTEDARRILPTVDLIAQVDKEQVDALIQSRTLAVTHFYEGLQTLRDHYDVLVTQPVTVLPAQLMGTVLQPNGQPAPNIAVSLQSSTGTGQVPGPTPVTITDDHGGFTLKL